MVKVSGLWTMSLNPPGAFTEFNFLKIIIFYPIKSWLLTVQPLCLTDNIIITMVSKPWLNEFLPSYHCNDNSFHHCCHGNHRHNRRSSFWVYIVCYRRRTVHWYTWHNLSQCITVHLKSPLKLNVDLSILNKCMVMILRKKS